MWKIAGVTDGPASGSRARAITPPLTRISINGGYIDNRYTTRSLVARQGLAPVASHTTHSHGWYHLASHRFPAYLASMDVDASFSEGGGAARDLSGCARRDQGAHRGRVAPPRRLVQA